MKWSFNHKSRKAFLTAAICLALSQSVFAMPTGGKVVDGTVTGILDNGTVANGTINVNSNALIDWTAFNIAKGETLNFKFGQDYLNVINHVTGSEMSQLLGTLNAKNGNVYLINPNGILVGGGARIDAGGLVLSKCAVKPRSFRAGDIRRVCRLHVSVGGGQLLTFVV